MVGTEKISKLREESENLQKEIRKQTLSYILAAFGLVAGLAWNEAVKSLIEALFPMSVNSISAKFLYALILTLVIVFISLYLTRIFRKEEENKPR